MSRVRSVGGHRRIALVDGWECASAPAGSSPADHASWSWLAAQVPGTAAGALRAAGAWSWDDARKLDGEDFWWRTRFAVETAGDWVLGFDGLATLAEVWLDGASVLVSDNMFRAHEVRAALGAGEHELVIRCRALLPELAVKRARPRWRVPMLEHAQLRWIRTTLLGRTPGWSPSCPAIGPWRPVWLEQRSWELGAVTVTSRLDEHVGVVEVIAGCGGELVVARSGGEARAKFVAVGDGRWRATATVANAARWWPHTHGEPCLYAVSIETAHGRIELGSTGFRTIEVERDGGDFAVRVNGVRVFCRGACWTPLDAVTLGASRDAVCAAVAQCAGAGMNMIRVGGTMVYEDDAFYDALDEHGVLLWQDLMFANMDYPEDAAWTAGAVAEVEQQLARLAARPSLAIVCGNSEGEQQAAMAGATRDRWSPALFHETFAAAAAAIGAPYVPSSTHGGVFPCAPNSGPASYYGVGAYLRPLEDARRAEVRFASECLAFANIPADSGLPGGALTGPSLRMHHVLWKARAPRDLGAGWDFDDVRDHYVARLFGVDPAALRYADHDRYVALGRAAVAEVFAQTFGEWRRARSVTRGGLVWFLRDLWPGAGWGVVDANGAPKSPWYAMRRACAPVAVAITDEGNNGLALHVANDRADAVHGRLELALYRQGAVVVARGGADVAVPAHGAVEVAAASLFEGFMDLSFAYRFGPPVAAVVHASLVVDGAVVSESHYFPVGLPSAKELDVGLSAVGGAEGGGGGARTVTVAAKRFAQSVVIEAAGYLADDNFFHLAPDQSRTVTLRPLAARKPGPARGTVSALNAEAGARFEVPA